MNKKHVRLTESALNKIVKEAVKRVLNESKEGYNQVMSILNKPVYKEKLKKAWDKEKKRNPNADFDTFKYYFAVNCRNKEREKDAKHYYEMRKLNRMALNEAYNQFSDTDFGSDGDPYGLYDDDEQLEDNLNGFYNSFNNIWVKIMNDDKPNAYIMVASKLDDQKQAFEGEEAQRILDKIRYDADNTYGTVQGAIYHNLYKYVL